MCKIRIEWNQKTAVLFLGETKKRTKEGVCFPLFSPAKKQQKKHLSWGGFPFLEDPWEGYVCLPTNVPSKSSIHVGKLYKRPVDRMGFDQIMESSLKLKGFPLQSPPIWGDETPAQNWSFKIRPDPIFWACQTLVHLGWWSHPVSDSVSFCFACIFSYEKRG